LSEWQLLYQGFLQVATSILPISISLSLPWLASSSLPTLIGLSLPWLSSFSLPRT
jgi:hypothetical protein